MIAQINGTIVEVGALSVTIDVGGLGYEVLVPASIVDASSLGQEARLFTYHHIRETSQELFGFDSKLQQQLFQQLLSVSGVGPKSALGIMSLGKHEEIRSAIASENTAYISAASGVGKRSAERICVELKDKVGVIAGSFISPSIKSSEDEALAALLALGYSAAQAATSLAGIDATLSAEERVRAALKELSQ